MTRPRKYQAWLRTSMKALAALVMAGGLVLAGQTSTLAHDRDNHPVDNFQSGQVTGKSDRSVHLNGREYALHPRVEIQDDEGRPKQLQDVRPDTYVRYQLKDDRVRQLILVTPK